MAHQDKDDAGTDAMISDAETETEFDTESETDPTELSIGKLVAYGVGGLTILVGVTMVVEDFFSGVIMIAAGAFGIPPIRVLVEDEFDVVFSRWLSVLIFLCMVVFASATASPPS